ncbi:MAG TPA: hypothetical protein PK659_09800 [Methanothrix sp.]|mgnify:CR=1 FL=1|nr:hypothetical protein [Methanothrix sp.]HOL44534.1 hypothetical protein [Methanothrix sp.]
MDKEALKGAMEKVLMRQAERERLRSLVLSVLAGHIGSHNAIGMGELYEEVFGEPWHNRINDTRAIRQIITDLRSEGVPICSVTSQDGGGYYLAAAGSELADYLRRAERRALKILKRNAQIKKISLPDYLGQLRLNMVAHPESGNGEAA